MANFSGVGYSTGMPRGRFIEQVCASVALLLPLPSAAQDPNPGRVDWTMVETIVSRIEAPRIPARTYRVTDCGAVGVSTA